MIPSLVALIATVAAVVIAFAARRREARLARRLADCDAETRTADAARRDAEERLRILQEGSRDAPWDWDLESGAHSYSPRWWEMLGYAVNELPAEPDLWKRLLHPDDRPRIEARLAASCRDGSASFEFEFQLRHKLGHFVPMLARGTIMRDARGKPIRLIGTNMDLTERLRADAALRQGAARLHSLTQSAQDAIVTADLSGNVVGWNPSAERMFGYSEDEIRSHPINCLLPARFHEAHRTGMARVREGGESRVIGGPAVELTGLRADGGEFPLELTLAKWDSDEGSFITSIIRDVSARHAAQAQLRDNEARYRAMFEANPQAMWVFDKETLRFLAVNDAAVARYGYSREEFLSRTIESIRPLEDLPRLRETLARHAALGLGASGFWRHVKRDGTIIDVEVTTHEIEFAGRPARLALAQDVTAQRRAAEELAILAQLSDLSPVGITVHGENGAYFYANRKICDLHGYTKDEFLALNVRDINVPTSSALFDERVRQVIATGEGSFEVEHYRKDGTTFPLEIFTKATEWGGRKVLLSAGADITDRKRAEAERAKLQEQFLQAQKMESVGRLAGGIAHDFNNVLTIITGTVEMASAGLMEGDPLADDLREIRRASERAESLTRQLLAFGSKQMITLKLVNVSALVAEMHGMLGRLIREDIDLTVAPAADVGSVNGDPGQIEQIVMNLVVNARDAMPTGGKLRIETRNVDIDGEACTINGAIAGAIARPGPYVMLVVSDTGVGMDAATRNQMFEPFYTTKERGKGTGLGLSTVYGIVEQGGGFITVESEPGAGTSIAIHFPRVDVAAEVTEQVHIAAAARGTETILVVEDGLALLRLTKRILQAGGYTVLMASDGAKALQVLDTYGGDIQMLLTDVVMPGISGPELAAQAVLVRPGLKVLYTSGYTESLIVRRGVADGSTNFIAKPYSTEDLMRKVREVLDRRPAPRRVGES